MRNFKILGLALIATLAMSAIGASAASADDLTAEVVGGIQLHGTFEPEFAGSLVTTVGNTTCKEVTYDIGTITVPTTAVTMAPTYPEKTKSGEQNCLMAGFPAVVHVNGCHYLLQVTGGASTVGPATLQCPTGNEITATATSAGTVRCTMHVPPQVLTGDPATYANKGGGTTREVTAFINAHGVIYKHTAGTGLGKCTGGSGANGTFVAKGTATGLNDVGTTHIGIFLSNV
jgi:hypothetical protein